MTSLIVDSVLTVASSFFHCVHVTIRLPDLHEYVKFEAIFKANYDKCLEN